MKENAQPNPVKSISLKNRFGGVIVKSGVRHQAAFLSD